MTHIESHPLGSFCWIELATNNQAAAKSFYGSLFGWQPADMPIGPGDFYTIFRLEGRDAAAAYTLRAEQQAQQIPPHWVPYILVDNVDATVARARELEGTLCYGPVDVFDAGRMAYLQDPTGAIFVIWQAGRNKGTGIAHVDGTMCWGDLSTPNPQRASAFYSGLFGWQISAGTKDPERDYLHIRNGEHSIAGIPPVSDRKPGTPPHWLMYFNASNCDAVVEKAKSLGATVLLPPVSMQNVGRFAVLADPQGAVFALFQHEAAPAK